MEPKCHSELIAQRDALLTRLDRGMALIAQAEAAGNVGEADRLTEHFRQVLAQYEAVEDKLQGT